MKIRMNVDENYKNFYHYHGGEPVIYGNRLLFRDGWMHDRLSKEGPAYPPGEDKDFLVTTYWLNRKNALEREFKELWGKYDSYRQLAETSDYPIALQVLIDTDTDQGIRKQWAPATLTELEHKLDIYRQEIKECEAYIHDCT